MLAELPSELGQIAIFQILFGAYNQYESSRNAASPPPMNEGLDI